MAIWGVVLSTFGLLITVGGLILFGLLVRDFMPDMDFDELDSISLADWEGVQAPEMTLPTLDAEEISLGQLKGKRAIVAMVSTRDADAADLIASLVRLDGESGAGDPAIIAVSHESDETLREFVGEHSVNFSVVSQTGLPSPFGDVTKYPALFFVDRKGVIQTILTGTQDYDAIRAAASAADFEGTPVSSPPEPREGLLDAPTSLKFGEAWAVDVEGALSVSTGDWNGDGVDDVLVTARDEVLKIFGQGGAELETVALPPRIESVAVIGHSQGPRLLGFEKPDDMITVMDKRGKVLWEYSGGWLPTFIVSADWGDLDGDGNDEIVASLINGIQAISEDGERLWRKRSPGMENVVFLKGPDAVPSVYYPHMFGVKVIGASGEELGYYRVSDSFVDEIAASYMGPDVGVQLLIQSDEEIMATSQRGRVAWRIPVRNEYESDMGKFCQSADIDGDGSREWIFLDDDENLVVVSPDGVRMGIVPVATQPDLFDVAPSTGSAASVIITLRNETVTAYIVNEDEVGASGSSGPVPSPLGSVP
jgi:peroxiredoxin